MEIQLSSSSEKAIIDDSDFELVKGFSWGILKARTGHKYAVARFRSEGKIRSILMHRLILDCKKGEIVDHVDNNGLNNSRANIRKCSHAENMHNCKIRRHSRTGVRNVFFEAINGKTAFRADVKAFGKRFRKRFFDLSAAGKWAEDMREKLHGEFMYRQENDSRLG